MSDSNVMTRDSDANNHPINVDNLLDYAREQTGLSDFGDLWFLGPLTAMVNFINDEGKLISPDARPVARLVENLGLRLRLVAFLKKFPQVREERIDLAGIMVGQSRGGSTLLHELLTSSSRLTAVQAWESFAPLPADPSAGLDNAGRMAAAEADLSAMYAAIPDLTSIHMVKPEAHFEEIIMMETSFLNMMFWGYFNIPSFRFWMRDQDHTPVYEELILWLKVLQFQNPSRRGRKWLLKSPQHLLGGGVATIARMFPGVKILMTHRDMKSVVGSNCSANAMMAAPYSTGYKIEETGPSILKLFDQSLRQLEDLRAQCPPGTIIDVRYKDLLAQPLVVYRDVMDQLGIGYDDADLEAAQALLDSKPRTARPAHDYKVEDFGISGAEIDAVFADYHRRYVHAAQD